MKRLRGGVALLLLLILPLMVAGCGSPPDIDADEIVGFYVGDDYDVLDDPTLPEPDRSLDRLLTAYNTADSAGWEGDTTPSLFAHFRLRSGDRVTVWLSSQYPEECATVLLWDAATQEQAEYEIEAPDLLPAVWELLTPEQRLHMKQAEQRLWLPD